MQRPNAEAITQFILDYYFFCEGKEHRINLCFTQQRWMEEGKIHRDAEKKICIEPVGNDAPAF
jgi:hypothetical protein